VLLYEESDVQVMEVNSTPFFDHHLQQRGQKRVVIAAAEGDTWRGLASKHGIRLNTLERINRRSRNSTIKAGQKIVIYTK
jgi:hypothetical protein